MNKTYTQYELEELFPNCQYNQYQLYQEINNLNDNGLLNTENIKIFGEIYNIFCNNENRIFNLEALIADLNTKMTEMVPDKILTSYIERLEEEKRLIALENIEYQRRLGIG